MASKYLHRGDAPFDEKVWALIDETAVTAATAEIGGRRILDIEGPYGFGLKAISGPDAEVRERAQVGGVEATLAASETIPVAAIQSRFSLHVRDIAAYEASGLSFDLGRIARAAIACARLEDRLVFKGSRAIGTEGLLTAKGVKSVALKSWEKVGTAFGDIMKACTLLDRAGFHEPYAMALAPDLYDLLFRLHGAGARTELEHVRLLVSGGFVKAAAIDKGGVLLAAGKQFASIAVGQDLMAGFVGPTADGYEFLLRESLALRIRQPEAVCVLNKP